MKISVLREEGLPKRGIEEHVLEDLQQYAEVELCYQSLEDILNHGICGDYFFNGHGEIYPLALEDTLYEFFSQGGGLLHIGGMPFDTAVEKSDEGWKEVVRTLGDLREHAGWGNLEMPMDIFRARLGMVPFDPPYPGGAYECVQTFDEELIGVEPISEYFPHRGIVFSTTVPLEIFKPELRLIDSRSYHGRPICRESITAGWVNTPSGEKYLPSLQFLKYYGNPFQKDQSILCRPWAVYVGDVRKPLPGELYRGIGRWINTSAHLKEIQLEHPTVHRGETVSAEVSLTETLPEGWKIAAYQSEQKKEDLELEKRIDWQECEAQRQGNEWITEIQWKEEALLLPVRFVLLDPDGNVRDYAESAVVCWDEEAVKHSRSFKTNGCYFDEWKDGKRLESSRWVSGTNWQDRNQYVLTWHNPNPLRIARDAKDMHAHGMVFVRTHYFMPGWFRVMPGEVFDEAYRDFYQSFEEGPEISERHLRALEAHVMLFSAFGLIFMPTVYTQTGANMGNPAHWTESSRMTRVKAYREAQKRFARQIMDRFGDCVSISWDVCNEMNVSMNEASDWLADMRTIFGERGHMLGIGTFTSSDSIALGESADWHSIHTPCCKTADQFRTGKPCLLQEAWIPTSCTPEGEEDLEKVMNKSIAWTLQYGGSGFMPWNWNMSHTNCRYQGGFVDYWDLELGCAVHPDGTPRRGRKIMQDWADLLAGLSFDQSLNRQVVFIYPLHTVAGAGCREYFDFFRKEHVPFLGVNDIDFAFFDLSETKAVFAPYYALGYRDDTWKKLVEFAESGGTVFAHNDNMWLNETGEYAKGRNIPPFGMISTVGKGQIRWYLGFNDSNMLGVCDKVLFEQLGIRRYSNAELPLENGRISFVETFSTEEKTMNTDWIPNQKLNDRLMPIKITIADDTGLVTRGWLKNGQELFIGDLKLSSEKPLFAIRLSENEVIVSGSDFIVSAMRQKLMFSLVDYDSANQCVSLLESRLCICKNEDEYQISLKGWQCMHWVLIRS